MYLNMIGTRLIIVWCAFVLEWISTLTKTLSKGECYVFCPRMSKNRSQVAFLIKVERTSFHVPLWRERKRVYMAYRHE